MTSTRRISVAGYGTVELSITEKGEGHPVLLLHGGGGPLTVNGFADLLAAQRPARVITPTHPGFGGTPRPDSLASVPGLAALYIALFHAMGYTGYITTVQTQTSAPMRLIASILEYGTYAVPIFIVLSGFCLMLPLAQRETTAIPGGALSYIRRRAWRLPSVGPGCIKAPQ